MPHSGRTSKGSNYRSTPKHPNPTKGRTMSSARNKMQQGMKMRNQKAMGRGRK